MCITGLLLAGLSALVLNTLRALWLFERFGLLA